MKRTSQLSLNVKQCFALSCLGLLTLLSTTAFASGFKLEFQSPSVLADGGDAAVIDDASTNWYNSAGLVYLPQQIVGAAMDVYSSTTFSGNTAVPATPIGTAFATGGTASAHNNSILPALHYSLPIKDRYAFGLSVVPAWGLLEDFGGDSMLRYDLVRVYTRTLDIAPSFAAKLTSQWSVGVGPDFHYFTIQSKSKARTDLITANDSVARFTSDDWSYGGHIGLMFNYNDTTRVGLNYRSKLVMNTDGYSDFAGPGLGPFESNSFSLQLPMPPTTSLSVYHDMTRCWALMGTVAYDQWSVLKLFHGQNVQSVPNPLNPTGVVPSLIQPQHMHNTIDLALGTHLKLNDKWMLRGSFKYEPTPTISDFRDVNFPDAEKLGINFGVHYQYSQKLAVDAIYAHVFNRTMAINGFNPLSAATATGKVRTAIDLAGAQVVYNI